MANQQIRLAKRPEGLPNAATWRLEEHPVPHPAEGQILVRQQYISLDPAMRGWLRDQKSYIPPVAIDDVMRAGGVGEVVTSHHPDFKEGDFVTGWGGVQQYVISDGKGWHKVDPRLAPLPVYLGTLGMPGLTAYFGLLRIGALQEGETVVVSGGAGAVGSVVGQIAKIKNCHVVGIAGGPRKCAYIQEELGFDAAIDYKNENIYKRLKETCPEGIDVYFDNVGGDILDTALTQLRRGARIPICGAISQYNATGKIQGPSNYMSLLVNRARMEGFVVMDFAREYADALTEMGGWLASGHLKTQEDIYEGIENFNETLLRLFSGDKFGKLVLKI
ncbi:NADP-dependent oxidoreductase [Flavilitoribacter nigricans]|uniref:NADP-dependent oxidoreductase n=1 Tax=Flavilitoribacter nigricans (strain ATCC 23147 / DSM 23189 / NBRC 102662 / NCIMB 1420 / SS-2) TaxID=1122177 RepID=A0A2D0N6D5_FLAN2|nr:NADP-dependent oxidoreductase [Flavilitoribacter nigricans]PHN03948.1 NADP-dependent oxidoreductase [Flavilitoribacter nigricans DSM 23189 = NBRC 102662]